MVDIKLNVPKFNLYDLQKFAEDDGLVGEKETFLLFTLASLIKMSVMIYSFSGSGKTRITDEWVKLIDKDLIYTLELSSNTTIAYDCEEINKKEFMFIPEFQLAMNSNNPIVIEVVKKVTEGQDAVRRVRNQSKNRIEKFEIKGELGVMSTFAVENKTGKFDTETKRRIPILPTDISSEQTKRVVKKIFCNDWEYKKKETMSKEKVEALIKYVNHCIKRKIDLDTILNPFMIGLTDFVPKDIRARSYAKHLSNFIKACTKFHINDRVKIQRNDKTYYIINFEDIYNIHMLYWRNFVQGVLGIPLLGDAILKIFDDVKNIDLPLPKSNVSNLMGFMSQSDTTNRIALRVADVHTLLKKSKVSVSYRVVKSIMDELRDVGYLEKDLSDKVPTYFKTDEIDCLSKKVDWHSIWEIGCALVKKDFPEVFDEWYSKQVKDNNILSINPYNGENEIILDLTGEVVEKETEMDISIIIDEAIEDVPKESDDDFFVTILADYPEGYDCLKFDEKYSQEKAKELINKGVIFEQNGVYKLLA